MIRRIMKAEMLLTRRCDLACSECAIRDNDVKGELSVLQWMEAFRIVYEELGADFVALYGGEPLLLGKKNLCKLFCCLSTFKPKTFTVISHSIGLGGEDAEMFMSAGCDSWTASVNTLVRSKQTKRDVAGEAFLRLWKILGGRDACAIITVSQRNLEEVPEMVEQFSRWGVWVGIDVMHHQMGRQGNVFSALSRSVLSGVTAARVQVFAEKMYEMAVSGNYLIMPTPKIFRMWENVGLVGGLTWHCSFPHSVTVDSNGELWACDDFPGENMRTLTIFDMPEKWDDWVKYWYRDTLKCRGCFWSTHILAEDLHAQPEGIEFYQHKRPFVGRGG